MSPNETQRKMRIAIFYTESSGTHLNTAKAINEAVTAAAGEACTVDIIDIWRTAPLPGCYMPKIFETLRQWKPFSRWHTLYSHKNFRVEVFNWFASGFLRKKVEKILAQPYDVIVAAHPLCTAPVLHVLPEDTSPPFIVVINDLATRNSFWFDEKATMTVVPTDQAMTYATQSGLSWQKVKTLGVPVLSPYRRRAETRLATCERLHLDPARKTILLAGGKMGVGPLEQVAQKVDETRNDINLLILAGKNQSLRQRLEGYNWVNTVKVFGYVDDLWNLMWLADIMVSKAGTGMLAEAINVGLPLILYHRVPYLEDANVSFMVQHGAGVWAPTPKMVVNALNAYLEEPDKLREAKAACKRLAAPGAAHALAELILKHAAKNDTSE
jgi:UDP-N-acetylglucosamine:LPS N-acetylglucosamine transferase